MHDGAPAPSSRTRTFALSSALRQQSVDLFDQLKRTSLVSRETYGASATAACALIESHAQDAGLETTWDAARNLIVRLPGKNPAPPAFATGSHLDSVPEGGNFDSAAGVVAGLATLLDVQQRGGVVRDLVLYALHGE